VEAFKKEAQEAPKKIIINFNTTKKAVLLADKQHQGSPV
jgi:hypothetical protein